jgi:hypothetical protein
MKWGIERGKARKEEGGGVEQGRKGGRGRGSYLGAGLGKHFGPSNISAAAACDRSKKKRGREGGTDGDGGGRRK